MRLPKFSVYQAARPYLYGVSAFSQATGMEPDMGKVRWWVDRGITVKARKA